MIGVSRKQFQFMRKKNFLPLRAIEQLGVVPSVQVSSRWLGIFKQEPEEGKLWELSRNEVLS